MGQSGQEEGNKGVKYMRERYIIAHKWDIFGRGNNHTHLRDKSRQEVGRG